MLDKVREAKSETEQLLEDQEALLAEVQERIEELDGLEFQWRRYDRKIEVDGGRYVEIQRTTDKINQEIMFISKVNGNPDEVAVEWKEKRIYTPDELGPVLKKYGFRKGGGGLRDADRSFRYGGEVYYHDLDRVEEEIADIIGTYIAVI